MQTKFVIFRLLCIVTCCQACTFPSDLVGEWYSTDFGTLTFTSTSFTGFTSSITATSPTFTCYLSSGSQYAVRDLVTLFAGVTNYVYLCMNLEQVTSIKYVFTLDSNKDSGTGVRFYTSSATDSTLAEICSYTDTRTDGEYHVLLLKAQIQSAFVACPSVFQTYFNVSMTSQTATNCDLTLDGRTSSVLTFNYTSCVSGTFSSGGVLNCLYAKTTDHSYVTVYNKDSTTDESSTYRFSCLTFSAVGAVLNATEHPQSCHTSQTPTSVNTPGIAYTMTDIYYSEVVDEKDFTVVIIVCCVIAGIIIIVIIALVLYFKVFRKKEPPPPEKIRKKKRKLSVTDYSKGSLSRANSVESVNDPTLHKSTTVEIITGIADTPTSESAADTSRSSNKQAWQKKWETNMRPLTPRSSMMSRLQRSKEAFPSVSGLTQASELTMLDLESAGMFSTSLPDSLDRFTSVSALPSGPSNEFRKHSDENVSTSSPKYTERSHASPKMPENSGKFGWPNKWKSIDTINMPVGDSKLFPITENPLSRENSTGVAKYERSKQNPHKELALSDRTFKDSMTMSSALTARNSIISAGDVRLNALQNLSRMSHLSASNSTIFDDPTWLLQNGGDSEKAFERKKTYLPGVPSHDQKWFTKTKKGEISNEDEYIKARANEKLVGLGLLSSTKRKGRQPVLTAHIIQDDAPKKFRKSRKTNVKTSWLYKWEVVKRAQSAPATYFRQRFVRTVSPLPTLPTDNMLSSDTTIPTSTNNLQQSPRSEKSVNSKHKTTKARGKHSENSKTKLSCSKGKCVSAESVTSSTLERTTSDQTISDHDDAVSSGSSGLYTLHGDIADDADMLRADTVSLSARSLDSYKYTKVDDEWDTVSLYSGVFYPQEWFFLDETEDEERWQKTTKLLSRKRKRERRKFLAV